MLCFANRVATHPQLQRIIPHSGLLSHVLQEIQKFPKMSCISHFINISWLQTVLHLITLFRDASSFQKFQVSVKLTRAKNTSDDNHKYVYNYTCITKKGERNIEGHRFGPCRQQFIFPSALTSSHLHHNYHRTTMLSKAFSSPSSH